MLADDGTARAMAVTPIGVMAFFDNVLTECDGHYVTKFAKRGVLADSHVTRVGNYYPIAVLNALVVIVISESVREVGIEVEELLEGCGVGGDILCILEINCKGIIYTARRISALGTCRTLEGVLAVVAADLTVLQVPRMLTLVAAYGAVAVR